MMTDWLMRERMLIGDEAINRLAASRVLLFGVGGVGSYVFEALVRAGVGQLTIVDADKVELSNLNRQLIADTTTLGMYKVDAAAERAVRINPEIKIDRRAVFADDENICELIDNASPDYIVDAIDTVSSKLEIIRAAKERGIGIVSSMGTGSKLDPTRFRIADISKTHTCPLAKVMRVSLRKLGIEHCDVLFSDEPPIKGNGERIVGSVSFVPSAAGLIIAGHTVKCLTGLNG